jgi:hypothetical protein
MSAFSSTLFSAVRMLDKLAMCQAHAMRPRELSNVLWAAAALRHNLPPDVLDTLMQVRLFQACTGHTDGGAGLS